ncbi:MAG: hypothetical protein GC191_19225 [Azospirillum sp.]|nr:hypothetical protein [Azospirillum sp.]
MVAGTDRVRARHRVFNQHAPLHPPPSEGLEIMALFGQAIDKSRFDLMFNNTDAARPHIGWLGVFG